MKLASSDTRTNGQLFRFVHLYVWFHVLFFLSSQILVTLRYAHQIQIWKVSITSILPFPEEGWYTWSSSLDCHKQFPSHHSRMQPLKCTSLLVSVRRALHSGALDSVEKFSNLGLKDCQNILLAGYERVCPVCAVHLRWSKWWSQRPRIHPLSWHLQVFSVSDQQRRGVQQLCMPLCLLTEDWVTTERRLIVSLPPAKIMSYSCCAMTVIIYAAVVGGKDETTCVIRSLSAPARVNWRWCKLSDIYLSFTPSISTHCKLYLSGF